MRVAGLTMISLHAECFMGSAEDAPCHPRPTTLACYGPPDLTRPLPVWIEVRKTGWPGALYKTDDGVVFKSIALGVACRHLMVSSRQRYAAGMCRPAQPHHSTAPHTASSMHVYAVRMNQHSPAHAVL